MLRDNMAHCSRKIEPLLVFKPDHVRPCLLQGKSTFFLFFLLLVYPECQQEIASCHLRNPGDMGPRRFVFQAAGLHRAGCLLESLRMERSLQLTSIIVRLFKGW